MGNNSEETVEELAEEEEGKHDLKRTIGYALIFILALNFIFDSSIFYIPQMGAELSGPSSIIAWIILFGISVYVAMCFAELISMFPSAGGIYEVSKIAYGTFFSFLAGWMTWLGGNLALWVSVPAGLELMILSFTPSAYIIKCILAIITVLVFSYLALKGKDIGSRLMAYSTVLILLVFTILLISTYIDLPSIIEKNTFATPLDFDNYKPFFKHDGFLSNFGFILATIFILATCFFGLEAVTFLSGEVKNPKKVMPKVLIWSMIIAMAVMFIFTFGSMAVLDQSTYEESYIFYENLMHKTLGNYGALITIIVVFLSGVIYFSEGFAWILASPRLIFSIAKDKLFPTSFAKLDGRYGTPLKAIKFQALILILGTIIVYIFYIFTEEDPFYIFHELWVFMALILVILLLFTIPILRKKAGDIERAYKVPFGNSLPYILAVFLIIVAACWIYFDEGGIRAFVIALILIALGIPVYFLLLITFDPEAYSQVKKYLVYFGPFYEFFSLNSKIRKLIYDKIGSLEEKSILLFGPGYGTITFKLAKHSKSVHIVDLSKRLIERMEKTVRKKGHTNIVLIHDEHQANRIHPSVPKVDHIISIGMLAHIQDLKKVVKEMYNVLPDGGKVIFKDEIDILGFVPNTGWAADIEKVIEILKEEGFSASYHVEKGFLFNHLIIYAMKTKENVPFV